MKRAASTGMKNIVFFGDSLTAGFGLPPHESFPARIQEKIDAASLPYVVHNFGISGDTSSSGRQRLPQALSRQKPDVFVLALGANDGLRVIPVSQTLANLRAILHEVRRQYPATTLVLAGFDVQFDVGAMFGIPALTQYAQDFNALFGRLAREEGAAFVPHLLANVLLRPELNLPDRVHPNAAGQRVLADNVWTVLEPILKQKEECKSSA